MQITINHPNKDYNGAIDGVQFKDGEAIVDSENTSHIVGGGSIEDIIYRFEAKGLTVDVDGPKTKVKGPKTSPQPSPSGEGVNEEGAG